MMKWVLTVCLLSLGCTPAAEEKKGKEKAIELLQKIKAKPRQLEVTVNRSGEIKTMKVDVAPMESPDEKQKRAPSSQEAKPAEGP